MKERSTTSPLGLAVLTLILGLAACTEARAQAYRTDSGGIEFTSSVPLHTFTGYSRELVGRIDLAERTVDFYVDLETLETGIGKRDKDMRSSLDTEEFPFAEFFGRLAGPFDPAVEGPQSVRVTGQFKLHGVERDIEVEGTMTSLPEGIRIEAAWSLRLDDYDIEPPSLLIIKVDPVQELRLDAILSTE